MALFAAWAQPATREFRRIYGGSGVPAVRQPRGCPARGPAGPTSPSFPSNKDGFWHDLSPKASRLGNQAKETAGGGAAQNRHIRRVAKNVPKPVLI